MQYTIVIIAAFALVVTALPSDDATPQGSFLEAQEQYEQMMQETGNGNACNDLAKATEAEVAANVQKEQDLLNKIDTGAQCPNSGQAAVKAATEAKLVADNAVTSARSALTAANGATVDWGKSAFSSVTEGHCGAFYSSAAYTSAKSKVNAAKAALAQAEGAASQAAKAVTSATTAAAASAKKCQCDAFNAHEKALKGANDKSAAANQAAWTKAAHLRCVVAGTTAANCKVPALPKVTAVALANGVGADKCGDGNNAPQGVNQWKNCVKGSGYGGITSVCGYQWTQHSGYYKVAWPIVKLSGTNIGSKTVSFHAGCGNTNGQDGCHAICRSLSNGARTMRPGWDVPCGNGYPAGADAIAPKCVYKRGPVSNNKNDYSDNYGTSQRCGNPMNWCSCQGNLP
jgi:hypothetical protein